MTKPTNEEIAALERWHSALVDAERALSEALSGNAILALVDVEAILEPKEDAQLARIVRYMDLGHGEWLVEFQALGRRRIERVQPRRIAEAGAGIPSRWVDVSKALRAT